MIFKWQKIEILKRENYFIFDVGIEAKKHENTNKVANFTKVFSHDWVNIIPITKEGKFVLIEQFRHGNDKFTIEIPGGLINQGELPIDAAIRECIEETGFSSDNNPIILGVVEPNPAFMNNKCYTFLWENCELREKQNFDEHEEIRVFEVDENELNEMVSDGKINHSIVLNALYYYKLYKERN